MLHHLRIDFFFFQSLGSFVGNKGQFSDGLEVNIRNEIGVNDPESYQGT